MSATSSGYGYQPGGTCGGRSPFTCGGRRPATFGPRHPPAPDGERSHRATGLGVSHVAQTADGPVPHEPYTAGGRLPARYGIGPATVGELINAADGFAVVLDGVGGHIAEGRRYLLHPAGCPPDEPVGVPCAPLDSLSLTFEANNLAGWNVTTASVADLVAWHFADVMIGFAGRRLFHGTLLPVSGDPGNQQVTLSGYGPLWRLGSGDLEFVIEDEPGWRALNRLYRTLNDRTNGGIRGYAARPPRGSRTHIAGREEFSGTPLAVFKAVHDHIGMLFSVEHDRPDGFVSSFTPGTQPREATWASPTVPSIDLDPTDYKARAVVRGAVKNPDAAPENQERYRAVATAPDDETRLITGLNPSAVPGSVFEVAPAPDDGLESNAACQSAAAALLAKKRANYRLAGSVDAQPTYLTPGYVYRVPAFDAFAPAFLEPVKLPLRQVEYSWSYGEASMSASFEPAPESAVVERLRAEQGARLPISRPPALGDGDGDGSPAVYPHPWPHEYP